MDARDIARICHEANRALCESQGDWSQPLWGDAPAWQRSSAIAGVEFLIQNQAATPEDSHKSWMERKEADGWVYGPVKDPEKLTHPCMVPYRELPANQQTKDRLFHAIVRALKDVP